MTVNKSLIKDPETRKAIDSINKKIKRIEDISKLSEDASNAEIVRAINKITDSMKRRR